jgi:hypothetical protein
MVCGIIDVGAAVLLLDHLPICTLKIQTQSRSFNRYYIRLRARPDREDRFALVFRGACGLSSYVGGSDGILVHWWSDTK